MMPHAGPARRKDRQIRSALALQPQLAVADGIADLVVDDRRPRRRRRALRMRLDLLLSPRFVLLGSGGVVTMAVDNHCGQPLTDVSLGGRLPSKSGALERPRRLSASGTIPFAGQNVTGMPQARTISARFLVA